MSVAEMAASNRGRSANLISGHSLWHLAAQVSAPAHESHMAARFNHQIAGIEMSTTTAICRLRFRVCDVFIEVTPQQLLQVRSRALPRDSEDFSICAYVL